VCKSITLAVNALRGMFTITEGTLWQARATKGFIVKVLSLKNTVDFVRCSPEGTIISDIIHKKRMLDFLTRYQPL
jgi:hypothetical protein